MTQSCCHHDYARQYHLPPSPRWTPRFPSSAITTPPQAKGLLLCDPQLCWLPFLDCPTRLTLPDPWELVSMREDRVVEKPTQTASFWVRVHWDKYSHFPHSNRSFSRPGGSGGHADRCQGPGHLWAVQSQDARPASPRRCWPSRAGGLEPHSPPSPTSLSCT